MKRGKAEIIQGKKEGMTMSARKPCRLPTEGKAPLIQPQRILDTNTGKLPSYFILSISLPRPSPSGLFLLLQENTSCSLPSLLPLIFWECHRTSPSDLSPPNGLWIQASNTGRHSLWIHQSNRLVNDTTHSHHTI